MSLSTPVDVHRLIDRYEARREAREPRLRRFLENDGVDFLVVQHPPSAVWGRCNSVEEIVANNLRYAADALEVDATDDLPFLEPWIGTGVYAAAFGCATVFREADAPHVRYRFRRMEEVRGLDPPDWRTCPILRMVLECIDRFLEETQGRLPICVTDTQSAFDTATLVVDACEVFAACYENEELLLDFLQRITDLVVEFSRVQLKRIGPERAARPGHQFPSLPGAPGFSISDDNLAVASPAINRRIAIPFDRRMGAALGGALVHSCGNWARTMAILRGMPEILGVECAVGTTSGDPTPNHPAEVRDALAGSGLYAKVRLGSDLEKAIAVLDELVHPALRLIVEIGYDPGNAERNYEAVRERLAAVYG